MGGVMRRSAGKYDENTLCASKINFENFTKCY